MSLCWMCGTLDCGHPSRTPERAEAFEAGLAELEATINEYQRSRGADHRGWLRVAVRRLRVAYELLRPDPSSVTPPGDVRQAEAGGYVGEPRPRTQRFRRWGP